MDDVLTVAAVRIRGNRILLSERFEATVRPEDARASADAIKVHRLRESDVAEADPMRRVLPELLRFIGGRPLVAADGAAALPRAEAQGSLDAAFLDVRIPVLDGPPSCSGCASVGRRRRAA